MSFSLKKVALALLFAAFPTMFSFAQTPQKVQTIIKNYDLQRLQEMENHFTETAQRDKAEAITKAQQRSLPVRMTLDDGGVAELQRVLPDGTLLYYRTFNVDAAKSTRADHLNNGGSLGLNLDGQNMTLGVWDGGHARASHQEYDGPGGTNRVTIMDGPLTLHFHAAHVTGTILASGVNAQAKGMAPQAAVKGYDWNSDVSEATTAAGNGLLLSNHSYGYDPQNLADWYFGAYDTTSRNWDALQYNAPYYLMVVAAGNEGTTNLNGTPLNPGQPQYDKLTGHAVSKNTLVVASAQDANVNANGDLISVNISSFSSQGPTDDYRIKPDITGNGHFVNSTYDNSNTAYNTISGTSMASPNVSGTLLLLQQHANTVNGNYLRAATLKGLALHTADDAGMTGPDAMFGWGLLNAKRMAESISQNGSATLVDELVLSQGQTYSITVQADGIDDLMASISWTDPAGTASSNLNNNTPRLVNDLDIRITQNTDTWYPWRLTGVNTNSNSGDNITDPFERVDVTGASGTYTLTVTHKGSLSGGSQNFSLVVTGIQPQSGCTLATVPTNLQAGGVTATSASLTWDPVSGLLYDLRFRESGTTPWTMMNDLLVANTTLTNLTSVTQYEVQVRSKCPGETPTGYSASVLFTTLSLVDCAAGSVSTQGEKISNITYNTINKSSTSTAGYEDFTALSTPVSRGDAYSFSATVSNASAGNQVIVWMDFNQNGDFSDAGEQVLISSVDGPWTGNITIPAGASLGTTRMRVRLHNTQNGPNTTPCGNSATGQVEDYTVVVYDDYVYHDSTWTPVNPNGVSTATDNILVVEGVTTLTGTTVANTLIIQEDAHLNINGVLQAQGDINNEGTLVFVSNATATGQLDTFSGTLTGTVEVQRYIPARRAFRLLSSPVSTLGTIQANWQEGASQATDNPNPGFGMHITGSTSGANGFDATPGGNHSLFTLNNAGQTWEEVTNTDVNTIVAGLPYRVLVRGDRSIDVTSNSAVPTPTTLRTTGTMHTGTKTVTTMSQTAGAFNFVGNPYQASVNMNEVIAASTNVNSSHYYVWDPTLGGNPTPGQAGGRGAYVAVELPLGTNTHGSAANQYLQPGQAAFVATLNNGSTSLSFQESHKDVTAPLTAVFSTDSRIDLRLYEAASFTAGSTPSDGLRLKFADGNTNAITSQDAPKFYNQDENLASLTGGNLYSIENRALPQTGDIIPLFTNQYRSTNYMFEIERIDEEGLTAYLRDHYTGSETELISNAISLYAFQVDPADPNSIADDRFEIFFDDAVLHAEDPDFGNDFVLFPNPLQGDSFFIATKNLEGQKVGIEVHSMLGRLVISNTPTVGTNGRVEVAASQLATGMYIITLSTEDGKRFTAKLINK